MLDIVPISLPDARALLGQGLPEGVAAPEGPSVPEPFPCLQLAYDEIEGAEIDTLLGYAGIPQANSPLGLPGTFAPTTTSGGWLLFPLDDLAAHLRSAAPDVAAAYEHAGSVEAYEATAEEFGAREYLVAGTLETLRFCTEHGLALHIRW